MVCTPKLKSLTLKSLSWQANNLPEIYLLATPVQLGIKGWNAIPSLHAKQKFFPGTDN